MAAVSMPLGAIGASRPCRLDVSGRCQAPCLPSLWLPAPRHNYRHVAFAPHPPSLVRQESHTCLINTARLPRCRQQRLPVAASAPTAAALRAVVETRGMDMAGAGRQALPDAATQQLQAHVQQLVYQLADASAAPAAAAQAADAGQQVMPVCQQLCPSLSFVPLHHACLVVMPSF